MLFGVAVAALAWQLTKNSRTRSTDVPIMISRAAAENLLGEPLRFKAVRDVTEKVAAMDDAEIAALKAWIDQRKQAEP